MLQLTKRTEYGLIALAYMAEREHEVVSVREIGERHPIPKRLLAEVLKDLCRAKLVSSQRGASGGYLLAESPDVITIGQVGTALEGRPSLSSCENTSAMNHAECDIQGVCPIRSPLQRIREGLWHLLQRTTLRSLVQARPAVDAAGERKDIDLSETVFS